MVKIGKFLVGMCLLGTLVACSDDDERDDTVLGMNNLTGKNWYYNGWAGEKNSYGQADLLEGIRFEQGGILKNIDFSGRREYAVGKWIKDENKIFLIYPQDTTIWNVQHSGDNYIETLVNYQGTRKYTTLPDYLGELTADAFVVNEYTQDHQWRTFYNADIRGNLNLEEGNLLLPDGSVQALEAHGYYWDVKAPQSIDFDGRNRELRFYLRVSGQQLKLRDTVYAVNLPLRLPAEVLLGAAPKDGGVEVTWNPYPEGDVYYKVEIFSRDMDLKKPFFVSRIQPAGTGKLVVKATTAGELNKIGQLQAGETYTVRLTALLYEPGIDPLNDGYSYANVQAVSYFTKSWLME